MKNDFTETHSNDKTNLKFSFLKKSSKDWLVLFICIVVVALLAYGFSFLKKPIYEAHASVTTNIHLHKEGPVTEFMLDSQVNHIGDLFFTPYITGELIAQEAKEGLDLTLEDLKKMGQVERRMLTTLIKIRHENPEIAARIATNWAKILMEAAETAYPYAVEVAGAKNKLILLQNCANPNEGVSLDAFCSSMTKTEYDQALNEAESILVEIGDKTLGLSEYLNISHYEPASVPAKPMSYSRGSMALAGGALGMLIAFAYFLFRENDA
jgi:uncharacterized protein involved in exopolysaccharide biosynthesis